MPKTITLLKIFIGSPSDVGEERLSANKVIEELNITFGSFNNIKLELVAWETHTHPNVGIDGQDVINKQIKGDYDIFLGIMWNRFGSKTSRAESGTEEEFELAYQKYLNENDISLLFYFKDTAKNLSEIDVEQLIKVNSFKKKLIEKGLLFRSFTELDEFEKLLRFALTSILQNYSSQSNLEIEKPKQINRQITNDIISLEAEEVLDDIEEIGFLESLELATSSMAESQKSITKMTKYIGDLGNNLSIQTSKIEALAKKPVHLQSGLIKKAVDQTAKIMNTFNIKMKVELPINSEHFNIGIRYYSTAMLTFSAFATNNSNTLSQIQSLKEAVKGAFDSVVGMRDSMKVIPSFTSIFAKAKKETVKILTETANEFQTHINLVTQLEEDIIKIINNSNNNELD